MRFLTTRFHMPEVNPHWRTLQNIAILLLRSGLRTTACVAAIQRAAGEMGFTPQEAEALLLASERASYQLPEQASEKDFELRVALLTLLEFGPLTEQGRAASLDFCRFLGLDITLPEALEQAFFAKSHKRHKEKTLYQNLRITLGRQIESGSSGQDYLDGVSGGMSISEKEIQESAAENQLIAPETADEKEATIRHMLHMRLATDPEDEEMLNHIRSLSVEWGCSEQKFTAWVSEVRKTFVADTRRRRDMERHNLDVYGVIFAAAKQLPWEPGQVAEWVLGIFQDKKVPLWPFSKKADNLALGQLAWLIWVRATRLDPACLVMVSIYLEMVKETNRFAALHQPLIDLEQTKGNNLIAILDLSLDQISEELNRFVQQIQW